MYTLAQCWYWLVNHDDVIKWKHFPRYWSLCREFTSHRWISLTEASDVFFVLRLSKWLSKQSIRWWFEKPWRPLCRHSNNIVCEYRFLVTPKSFSGLQGHGWAPKGILDKTAAWKFNHAIPRHLQHSSWPSDVIWQHRPTSTLAQVMHYDDVIMTTMASQITSLTIVYSTVYSVADQRKHQSSASLAFVWGVHRGPVNSPHKWPVTRKMFPFDDVIMGLSADAAKP